MGYVDVLELERALAWLSLLLVREGSCCESVVWFGVAGWGILVCAISATNKIANKNSTSTHTETQHRTRES